MPRKEKKYHFIYKTVNILTFRYYIGMHSTDNIDDGYLGSGKRLRYSIRKYGVENHKREILEYCDSREELVSREEEIVTLNEIAKEECMNLVIGGQGGFTEDIQKLGAKAGGIAKSLKLKEDIEMYNNLIKTSSQTLKKAHSEGKIKYNTFTGRKHTNETKKNMSITSKGMGKGSNNSQYGTCWITNGVENKKIKKEDLELWESKGFKKGRLVQ